MGVMPASRIDTHHHAVPDFYRAWLAGLGEDAGGMPIPKWTPEASRKHMRRTGVRTAILSVSTPQVALASRSDARALARDAAKVALAYTPDTKWRNRAELQTTDPRQKPSLRISP